MMIERKQYVDKLLSKSWNGKVKIVAEDAVVGHCDKLQGPRL